VTYIAFFDHAKAKEFERYIKSGSGHAFATGDFGSQVGHRRLPTSRAARTVRSNFSKL
jgi:hypothetical protein